MRAKAQQRDGRGSRHGQQFAKVPQDAGTECLAHRSEAGSIPKQRQVQVHAATSTFAAEQRQERGGVASGTSHTPDGLAQRHDRVSGTQQGQWGQRNLPLSWA